MRSFVKAPAFLALLLMVSVSGSVWARPIFLKVLETQYPDQSAAIQTRSCSNCHVSPTDLTRNPYGKALEAAQTAAGKPSVDAAVITSVGTQSLSPGAPTFAQRIEAGQAPDTLASVPLPATKSTAAAPKTSGGLLALIPSNAMHPAVVHFPIALFILGVILDLIGAIRKDKTFLLAGWYNLAAAAVSSLGAVASGFLAIYLMKAPLQGLLREHMLLAVTTTVLMWILFALRVDRHEKMGEATRIVYYILAALALGLITFTGHLGGMYAGTA